MHDWEQEETNPGADFPIRAEEARGTAKQVSRRGSTALARRGRSRASIAGELLRLLGNPVLRQQVQLERLQEIANLSDQTPRMDPD